MRAWVVASALLLPACSGGTRPESIAPTDVPADSVVWYNQIQVVPPPLYARMYERMEVCTGIEGGFRKLRWLGADMIIDRRSMRPMNGVWIPGPPPLIGLDFDHVYNPRTVAHEILHDILLGSDPHTRPHADPRFTRCLGTVRGW